MLDAQVDALTMDSLYEPEEVLIPCQCWACTQPASKWVPYSSEEGHRDSWLSLRNRGRIGTGEAMQMIRGFSWRRWLNGQKSK